jgi:Zn finger protein HypA/HybF involved in hydrogenase expression
MYQHVLYVMLKVLYVKYVKMKKVLFFHLIFKQQVFVLVCYFFFIKKEKSFFYIFILVCQSCFHIQCHKNQKYICPKCQRNKQRKFVILLNLIFIFSSL